MPRRPLVRALDLLILGVNSTAVTIITPWYPPEFGDHRISYQNGLGSADGCEISFDGPLCPLDIESQTGIIGLALRDSAYFQKSFVGEYPSRALPVARPKNVRYSDPLLGAVEWLFSRYLWVIYRVRGLIEAVISRLTPYTNRTRSSSPRGCRVETSLRGLSQNILSLGCVLDRYIRETWGLTIGGVVRLTRGSSEDERGAFDTFYHMLLSVLGLEKRPINPS